MTTVSVCYITDDVDAAVAFYVDRLGFRLEMRPGPGFAMLSRGALRLLLNRPDAGGAGQAMPDGRTPEPGGWNRIQIEISDLSARSRRYASRGELPQRDRRGAGRQPDPARGPRRQPRRALPARRCLSARPLNPEPERSSNHAARAEPHHQRPAARRKDRRPRVSDRDRGPAAQCSGPPLHTHDFDEAFYVLEGELIFQVEEDAHDQGRGRAGPSPRRNVAHALANHSDAPARYVLVCTPAGFERHWARIAADAAGIEPPQWALQPIPEVTVVGPHYRGSGVRRGSRALGTWTRGKRRVLASRMSQGLRRSSPRSS